ncbi:MAG: hypothetical protein LBB24_02590, partial [Rickettsiales bacterium]|nr:hypothetical protein [Rickettsiales bacterium]
MKNRRFILALTLLLGVVTCAFLFKNFKIERRSNSNAIFATSTKGNITMAEVDKYLANFRKNFGQNISLNGMKEEEKKIIAVDIFNNRIILEKAKAGGLANSKEYMEKLSEAKDSLLRAMFLENLVAENISDEMVKA